MGAIDNPDLGLSLIFPPMIFNMTGRKTKIASQMDDDKVKNDRKPGNTQF
jgi:hypothetical protein